MQLEKNCFYTIFFILISDKLNIMRFSLVWRNQTLGVVVNFSLIDVTEPDRNLDFFVYIEYSGLLMSR